MVVSFSRIYIVLARPYSRHKKTRQKYNKTERQKDRKTKRQKDKTKMAMGVSLSQIYNALARSHVTFTSQKDKTTGQQDKEIEKQKDKKTKENGGEFEPNL